MESNSQNTIIFDQKSTYLFYPSLDKLTTRVTIHRSLVDYLAQVIYAKNCPATLFCIFQLVWVPMTTMQNIRECLWTSNKTLFS